MNRRQRRAMQSGRIEPCNSKDCKIEALRNYKGSDLDGYIDSQLAMGNIIPVKSPDQIPAIREAIKRHLKMGGN